jgi:hemerythrin-like domain-containing protein
MSKAISDLMNEHGSIQAAILVMDRMSAALQKNSPVELDDIRLLLDFLKGFADQCHHGKEEGFLFPAMVKAGVPDKGGVIGVMLAEHAQGRQLIRDMEAAISNGLDSPQLCRLNGRFATLYKNHIRKENGLLFPTADKLLSADQKDELFKCFEEFEAQVMHPPRNVELHATLERLQEKYPG